MNEGREKIVSWKVATRKLPIKPPMMRPAKPTTPRRLGKISSDTGRRRKLNLKVDARIYPYAT